MTLFDKKCIDKLHSKLLETIEHLIFYDYNINPKDIPARSKTALLEYNHSSAWTSLLQNKPEGYRKKKKSFATQVTKVSGVDWNKLLYDKVNEASKPLINLEAKPVLQQASF